MKLPLHSLTFLTIILVALSFSGQALGQGEMRTWRDANGREIKASVDGFEDSDTIILKLQDGGSISYPVAKLSFDDIAYAAELFKSHGIDWTAPLDSDEFVIRSVSRERAPGYVLAKAGWQYEAKCILAKVQYKGDLEVSKGKIKAYFYNREGKLIDTIQEPPKRQDDDGLYINAPTIFQNSELFEAYFPLTEFLEESDWATVLIAFGLGSKQSVATMPKTSFEKFEFAEKKIVFPDWKPASTKASSTDEGAEDVELEIRRLGERKHRLSISFNGDYREGQQCIAAEVRAIGEISPGDCETKLHYFDANGKRIGTRRQPSSTEVVNGETYVENPRIADDRWHPVFFALDRELMDKKYPTFVLVFEFAGKTTAMVESSVGATLEKLSFPEKSKLPSREKTE